MFEAEADAAGIGAAAGTRGARAIASGPASRDCDPQSRALEWLTEVDGTKIGRWPVAEAPFKLARTPAHIGGLINRGAACYAEDNEYVLGELLGHSTADIRGLEAEGVI